ncbi:MAG: hypothetical protein K0U64_02110 [Actinomycetia bacterium]|nr:hypothetical protein [Actinomycetes bacterium]
MGGVAGPLSLVTRAGREWSVRPIPGQSASKDYVCPFCERRIGAGTPHLVVWPNDEPAGMDQRRHWHTQCWGRYR